MKIVLIVIGALIAVVVVSVLIGAMLPRDHAATRRAVYRAPREAVYRVVRDFAAAPQWRTGVKKRSVTFEGPAGAFERG